MTPELSTRNRSGNAAGIEKRGVTSRTIAGQVVIARINRARIITLRALRHISLRVVLRTPLAERAEIVPKKWSFVKTKNPVVKPRLLSHFAPTELRGTSLIARS